MWPQLSFVLSQITRSTERRTNRILIACHAVKSKEHSNRSLYQSMCMLFRLIIVELDQNKNFESDNWILSIQRISDFGKVSNSFGFGIHSDSESISCLHTIKQNMLSNVSCV